MRLAGMQPPEGPPVWAALNFLPLGQPPPISCLLYTSPHVIDPNKCIKCGACMDNCRFGAISKH